MPYEAHDRLLTLAGEARKSSGPAGLLLEPVVAAIVPELADGCSVRLFGTMPREESDAAWSPFHVLLEDALPVAFLDDTPDSASPTRLRMTERDAILLQTLGVRSAIGIPLFASGEHARDETGETEEGWKREMKAAGRRWEGGEARIAWTPGSSGTAIGGAEPGVGEERPKRRLIGALLLFMTSSGRSFREADVAGYEEVGRRLSSALYTEDDAHGLPPVAISRGETLDLLVRRHSRGQLERFATEEELLVRRRQQDAVAQLARFAISEIELIPVMREAVRLIRTSLDVEFGTVLEFLPEEGGFAVRATSGFPAELLDEGRRIPSSHASLTGFTLESGGLVLVDDIRTETRFEILDLLRDHGIRSAAAVLIEGVGRPWGVFAVHSLAPGRFTPAEGEFLQTMADVLGQAVERNLSLMKLDTTRRELESVTENAPDIILRFDGSAHCIYANSAIRQLGITPSDIVGKTVFHFPCSTESARKMERAIKRAVTEGKPLTTECTLFAPGNERRLFECRLTPEPGPEHDPQPRSVLALLRDVTERRTSEDWLRYQATLLDTIGEGVTAFDPAGRIIYWNRGAEVLHGLTFEEAIGQDVLEVTMLPEERAWGERLLREIAGGGEWSGEMRLLRKDGGIFEAFVTVRPVRDERGAIIGIVAVSMDLTERLRLEEQLRQAQRMEAVGRLAGGVAHEFNNILTAVAGYTDLLLTEMDPADPAFEFAREIDTATSRAIALTAQLLAFSRKQVLQPRVIAIRDVLAKMKKLLQRVLGEDIDLVLSDKSRRAAVLADPAQVEQVIMNLAVNARDAMPLGGTLTIRVDTVESPRPDGEDLPPGRNVRIAVSDTGTGIPPEVQPHVFEPFFTTKPKGRGIGLGLATVHGILQQSGGAITIRSIPGEGTTFFLYLPEVGENGPNADRAGDAREDGHDQDGDTEKHPPRTVLVAEDENSVRLLLTKLLPRLGYRVLEAENGAEALALCREEGGRVDLVLTDVIMPVMGGAELAEQLAREFPEIPVLFMSGYTDEMLADRNIVEPGVLLLKKPFTVDELSEKLAQAFAAGRRAH